MKRSAARAKRLKRTGSGKLKRAGAWKQHKLEGKARTAAASSEEQDGRQSDERKLQVLVPYL
jgi:ribosomal protein L35